MTLRLLILYEPGWTGIATVREYLDAFRKYSRHDVWYAVADRGARLDFSLDAFDAVVIHYSLRLCVDGDFSAAYARAMRAYRGLKLAIVQDDYDETDKLRAALADLGVDVLFTGVPPSQIEKVYPRAQFPQMECISVLTGYAPEPGEAVQSVPDPKDRPILIGYRGRPLPYWYGALGQEKIEIGRRMRAICEARNLPVDIKWGDEDRIYGGAWYDFIRACRVMLGTETGASVFDDRGEIRRAITEALAFIPDLTFDEAARLFIGAEEGRVKLNEISPKIFEAIIFRTGLVLFEGRYSGVLEPGRHYISLKKDFSNVDDVLAKVQDADYVREMTACAYCEIVASGAHSYRVLVATFDDAVDRHARPGRASAERPLPEGAPITRHIGDKSAASPAPAAAAAAWQTPPWKTAVRRAGKRAWLALPRAWRLRVWPAVRSARAWLNRA